MATKFLKMLKGSSSSHQLLTDLENVTCPICLEIYEKALIVSCGHTFCSKCLANFDVPEPLCPLCRQTFDPSKTVKSSEVNKLISSHKGACHGCSKEMLLSKLRVHVMSCPELKEQVQSMSIPVPESEDAPANRHTFRCPYCGLLNLDTQGLIKHVNDSHFNATAKVTCPICVSMPWGNQNQVSSNFIGHLNHRHQFEYDTFVDYEIDDQTALEQALKASLEEEGTP